MTELMETGLGFGELLLYLYQERSLDVGFFVVAGDVLARFLVESSVCSVGA
jgi:hypothetical protein